MKPVRISVSSLAIAGFIAFGLSAAPIGVGDNFASEIKLAFAKGKSSGKGGKGGKSSSKSANGGGADIESADSDDEDPDKVGNGHIKAKGNGHAKNHDDGVEGSDHDDDGAPNDHGKLASSLGNLNAAHASPTALENANRENSIVGLLPAYAEAVEGDPDADPDPIAGLTPEEQREALGEISNKSGDDGLDEEDDAGTDDEDGDS